MRRFVALAGLALAGCNVSVDDGMVDEVENSVRTGLAPQGQVKQVEMTRESDARMTGHADVVLNNPPGVEARFTCTANRRGDSGTTYDWECAPPGAKPAPAP